LRDVKQLGERVSAARREVEARGETFYPGASRIHLAAFPPKERWDNWVEVDARSPDKRERRYLLVPTTCFNCESACGLLAYVDRDTLEVRKLEGNPEHPGSRGRNCAKGPATLNQVTDPDRILHPLKRAGERGEGRWVRVTWDEALDDIAARIRKAIVEQRPNEVMYHVGRPGEDGFTERVLAAWGIDGHNSHTNICSSSGRAGYHFWMGFDRPSPDYANADVIVLVSAHLESGHYFNPHAQRIMEAKQRGAKLIVLDVRLSNTATHADHWIAPQPGSEAAIFLAIAHHLVTTGRYNRAFVERWWNWQEYMTIGLGRANATFADFERELATLWARYTFDVAAEESGVPADALRAIADAVAGAGTRLATHNWRSAAAGNLGGWQVSRTLFLLNALLGAVACEGGVYPNGWNKFVPRPIHTPPHPHTWNELTWPVEYPLALNELSFLLPHLVGQGRGALEVYFSRVYNPVWTNPDGFSWIEMLTDPKKVRLHVALTPTWSETAQYADYVLPMGVASERHDVHSYETHDAQWLGFRQPVLRAARERLGKPGIDQSVPRPSGRGTETPYIDQSVPRPSGRGTETPYNDTRDANPGEVWEENEFWIELSWRIDRDGALGIRKYFESKQRPGEKLGVDEYYQHIFEHSVPGLPERAAAEGTTPLAYMRRYGAFEVRRGVGPLHEAAVPAAELVDTATDSLGRVFTRAPKPAPENIVPVPTPDGDATGRRMVGVALDGEVRRGFPTPSGRLELWSRTLAEWGWPEYALPTYITSHVHPSKLAADQLVLVPTFRLPVQVHTRSGNAKWLDELAHTNPLWLHPRDAGKLGVATGELVRVETELGYFVVKAWVTEGIRPGVVACSHHMGRWKLDGQDGQRQIMATVGLEHDRGRWSMRRQRGVAPYASSDPDTRRIWWSDAGVHQNLTFAVHPDPISGMHCWHQAVRVRRAEPGDRHADIAVDTAKSRAAFERWLADTRPADRVSPDGTRRPYWMLRPLKPAREVYALPKKERP
jgi:anaerobic selenocysteine-containing dehydrogenase